MAFKMGVENLSGYKVIPAGIYSVQFKGFRPRWNKNKDGVNFNAQFEVINNPDYDGAKLFESCSNKAGFIQAEVCHMLGLSMEDEGNGVYNMPGIWDGDAVKFKEDDPTTWVYEGPMLGRTGEVEVAIDVYEGKENNKVRQYIPAKDFIPPYEFNHITDLLKKK